MHTSLSPIVHQYNWSLFRVPLKRKGDSYTLFVGDNFTRTFDENTLPDKIKSAISMILARSPNPKKDHEVYKMEIYQAIPPDSEMSEVGWQASESWFCVVLPNEMLIELQGGTHDPRS